MLFIRHRLFLFILCCLCIFGCDDVRDGMLKVHITGGDSEVEVTGIPPELVEMYKADVQNYVNPEARLARYLDYYTKYIDAGGTAIIGNRHVRDEQFYVAREIILHMTSKYPEMREPLSLKKIQPGGNRFRVVLLSTEEPVDSEWNAEEDGGIPGYVAAGLPENPDFIGGGYCSGRYCVARMWWKSQGKNKISLNSGVLVHEFAHALHMGGGVNMIYPDFHERLRNAYYTEVLPSDNYPVGNSMQSRGYGNRNVWEYWAELTKDWFMKDAVMLTMEYKWSKQDQLMLPIMEDLYPKIHLYPLNRLERPIEWDWDPDWIR